MELKRHCITQGFQSLRYILKSFGGWDWGGGRGGGEAQVVDCWVWRPANAGSTPQLSKAFSSPSQLSVQTLMVFAQPPCAVPGIISICVHNTNLKHQHTYHCLDTEKYSTY